MDKSEQGKKSYQELVKEVSPNSPIFSNCIKAFIFGGLFCLIGQGIMNIFMHYDFSKEDSSTYTTIILIFAGVFLTGISVYDKIGKHAGAGSVVPITGFANSVAAPAIEYKKEGFVLGVASKMFLVAGPVIVYGILSSVAVGIVYYIITLLK